MSDKVFSVKNADLTSVLKFLIKDNFLVCLFSIPIVLVSGFYDSLNLTHLFFLVSIIVIQTISSIYSAIKSTYEFHHDFFRVSRNGKEIDYPYDTIKIAKIHDSSLILACKRHKKIKYLSLYLKDPYELQRFIKEKNNLVMDSHPRWKYLRGKSKSFSAFFKCGLLCLTLSILGFLSLNLGPANLKGFLMIPIILLIFAAVCLAYLSYYTFQLKWSE